MDKNMSVRRRGTILSHLHSSLAAYKFSLFHTRFQKYAENFSARTHTEKSASKTNLRRKELYDCYATLKSSLLRKRFFVAWFTQTVLWIFKGGVLE